MTGTGAIFLDNLISGLYIWFNQMVEL